MPRLMLNLPLLPRIALVIALAALTATALAQTMYRSVMPDGRIVYGNKPEPGAKESKPVNLPPPNIASPNKPPAGAADKPPAGKPDAAPAKDGKDTDAPDVAAARQKLEAAQKTLEAGREPREGERTGTATKGMSRLNDEYYKRVKALEDAVATAQAEYDTALRAAR
jgi:hypothetical protein